MATILSINATIEVTGGADRFFNELNRLMLHKGERVITFTCKPCTPIVSSHPNLVHYFIDKEIYPKGLFDNIAGLIEIFYAPHILKDLEKIINKEKPIIAHIHNIYHRIPYGIIDILNKYGVKTIWWLHDYKWLCPNNQLYTRGSICKRCKSKSYFNAAIFRCQLNSLLKSSIASCFSYFISLHKYQDKIVRFIAPSQSTYSQYKEFDFPISKVNVLPHFSYDTVTSTWDEAAIKNPERRDYALYVGRIEENKGLSHLVHAFGGSGYPLTIIGTGNYEVNLKKYCKEKKYTNVEFIGYTPPDKLSSYYHDSLFIVVPSIWYEVFGLTILEAFSHAKPVVAADIGAIPEIVENGKTGILYQAGVVEDLRKKIKWTFENPAIARQMGLAAQKVAERRFSPEKYWEELQKLHHELIN